MDHLVTENIFIPIDGNKILILTESSGDTLRLNNTFELVHIEYSFFQKYKKVTDGVISKLFLLSIEVKDFNNTNDIIKLFKNKEIEYIVIFSMEEKISKLYRRTLNSEFEEIFLKNELFLARLKFSKISINNFDFRMFFTFLNCEKCSIMKLNFWKVLKTLGYKDPSDQNLMILNSIIKQDVHLQKLLFLFVSNAKSKVFLSIIVLLAQRNEFNQFKCLIAKCDSFTKYVDYTTWIEVKEILKSGNYLEFAIELQKLESYYYKEFYEEDEEPLYTISDAQYIPRIIQNLHKYIKNGELNAIKKFTEKYSNFKICQNFKDQSALERSIIEKKFNIYSFLLSMEFISNDTNQLAFRLSLLSDSEKEEIRKHNTSFSKENPQRFIYMLISKCDVHSYSSKMCYDDIKLMIKKLSRNPDLLQIFKITSQIEFKIIFDYANDNVKSMVPGGSEISRGLSYYKEGLLYVGKDLSKEHRYGTLTHELMHLALYYVYENDCLPYCKQDEIKRTKWNQIVKEMREVYLKNPSQLDEIIQWVFKYYEPEDQLAELAVRIPHIIAYYLDDSSHLITNSCPYLKKLSDFHYKFIISDFSIPNVMQLIKLNNDLGLITQIEDSIYEVDENVDIMILNNSYSVKIIQSNIYELALSQVYHEIKVKSKNKLDLKVKNIFIDLSNMRYESLKQKFEQLINTSKIERLVIKTLCFDEKVKAIIKKFSFSTKILIITPFVEQDFLKDIIIQNISFTWNNLSLKTQLFFLNKSINFQGNIVKVYDIFDKEISTDVLNFLYKSVEINVNCASFSEDLKKFIPREIVHRHKKREDYELIEIEQTAINLEKFLKFVKNNPFVLITDIAGSGKTTILKKINEIFTKSSHHIWVSFIPLNNHYEMLHKGFDKNLLPFIIQMLKLGEFEQKIFEMKFLSRQMIILVDGFDEISPLCKEETMKILKEFKNNEIQCFVTSRIHIKHDLENELDTMGHYLMPFKKEDQIEFLIKSWSNGCQNDLQLRSCANLLVNKISEIIADNSSPIGVPLIVHSLAQHLKEFIGLDLEFKIKVKSLNLLEIFKTIFDACLQNFSGKYKERISEFLSKREAITKVLECLAVRQLFLDYFIGLKLHYECLEWDLEDTARAGIIWYDEYEDLNFTHQIYAEYLVAVYIFNEIARNQLENIYFTRIFCDSLTERKWNIIRKFLNELIQNLGQNHNFFPKNLSKIIDRQVLFAIFKTCFNEFHFKITDSLIATLENDVNLWSYIFLHKNVFESSFSVDIEKFIEYTLKIFKVDLDFMENIFMMPRSTYDVMYFYLTLPNAQFTEVTKKIPPDLIRNIFLQQHKKGNSIILYCISNNLPRYKNVLRLLKTLLLNVELKNLLSAVDRGNKNNIMHCLTLCLDISAILSTIRLMCLLFQKSEIKELITSLNKESENCLHVEYKSFHTFKIIIEFIATIYDNDLNFLLCKEVKMGNNILQSIILNENSWQILDSYYSFFEKIFCTQTEKFKCLLFNKNVFGENCLSLIIQLAPVHHLRFYFENIDTFICNITSKMLYFLRDYNGNNVLNKAIINNDSQSFKFILNYFNENEILELCQEIDENGNNIVYTWLLADDENKNVEYLLNSLNKTSSKIILLHKNLHGENALFCASKQETTKFLHLFDIYCNILEKKDFLYDTNENRTTFFQNIIDPNVYARIREKISHHEIKNVLKLLNGSKSQCFINFLEEGLKFFSCTICKTPYYKFIKQCYCRENM